MKRIRILTGRHIGSSLDLAEGLHRIGPTQDCDVAITDWDFEPLKLIVDEQGVRAEWDTGLQDDGTPAPPGQHTFDDFVGRRFGDIVVCVGPSVGTWPADIQLLDHVFQPTPQRVARWAGKRLLDRRPGLSSTVGATAVLALVLGFGLWLHEPAPKPLTLLAARQSLQASLDRIAPGRLAVTTEASALVVTGVLDTTEQAHQTRQMIASARGPYPAVQRFAVAADVATTIRGSVGLPNAVVRHAGNGVFSVVAEATDVKAARAAIDRIQADLAPVVSRIDVTLEATEVPDNTPIRSRMTSEGLSVVQTRDGVKHMVVRSAEDSPVTVGDVLALPSPLEQPAQPVLRATQINKE